MELNDMQEVIHIENTLVNFMLNSSFKSLKKHVNVDYQVVESKLFNKMRLIATW